jgi:TrfA protein
MSAKPFEELAKQQMERVTAAPVQLAFWAEDRRGAPNALLRAAVFCAGKPTSERRMYRARKVAVLGPYTITYTGPQVFQSDLDFWLELMHICRGRPLGTLVRFPMRRLLKSLGYASVGKKDRVRAIAIFSTLREVVIDVQWTDPVTHKGRQYVGGLVNDLGVDNSTGEWCVSISPMIAELFAPSEHTWLQAMARRSLGKSYLAKWLHSYFSTHAKPHPIRLAALLELSGSENTETRGFRRRLKAALDEVAHVETSEGRVFGWHLDDDVVHVTRG